KRIHIIVSFFNECKYKHFLILRNARNALCAIFYLLNLADRKSQQEVTRVSDSGTLPVVDILMLKSAFFYKFNVLIDFCFIFASHSTQAMQNLVQTYTRTSTTMTMTPWGVR
ncbi:MAG: hypothetical protein WC904_10055, partial [Proteiniphilum sp.]